MRRQDQGTTRTSEAGFTLIEALIAVLVLVIGIMAIASLFAVAATSNSVANQSTAATSAAAETLEQLKAMPFSALTVGGGLTGTCTAGAYSRCDNIPGVGIINTHWRIASATNNMMIITVRSEGTGVLSGARSRAEFTTFRSCTDVTNGCPQP